MKSLKYYWERNKLQIKIIFLVLLVIAFIINLIIIGVQKNERRKARAEKESVEQTSVPESGTEVIGDFVPESGTTNCISNLEEYAVPILQDQSSLLETSLLEFLEKQNSEQKEAEIFHVMIPEDDSECVKFFLRLSEFETLVEMTFDRTSETVETNFCEYTEEEVLAEIWEGYEPDCKDVEE